MDKYQELNPQLNYFIMSNFNSEWSLDDWICVHSFTFFLDGSAEYEINGKIYKMEKNDLLYVPPESHRVGKTGGMRVVAIDFALPDVERLELPDVIHINDITKYLYYFQEINRVWLQKGAGYQLRCKGYLILILCLLFNEMDDHFRNKNVEEIKNYIVKNYMYTITVDEIADFIGLSPVYCGAIFKKYESVTIKHYINQIRISQAINYMKQSKMNISEIAYQTGFNDVYYFSRTFKKMVGIPPSDYRKRVGIAESAKIKRL